VALWTPTRLSDLAVFWDADSVAGSDGGTVASWVDEVSGFTLVEATNQPTVQTNELNGHNTIRFDGTNDNLDIASTDLGIGAQPFSVFAVWLMADSNQQVLWQSNTGGTGQYIESGLITQAGSTPSVAITRGAWRMTCARYSGASSSIAIDGAARSTINPGTNGLANAFCVGRSNDSNVNYFLQGDIRAVLFLDGAIDQDSEDLLFGWAAWDNGLEANLASGHPYEDAPPLLSGGFLYLGRFTGIQIPQATQFRLGG
jgi:hypothetical protein